MLAIPGDSCEQAFREEKWKQSGSFKEVIKYELKVSVLGLAKDDEEIRTSGIGGILNTTKETFHSTGALMKETRSSTPFPWTCRKSLPLTPTRRQVSEKGI